MKPYKKNDPFYTSAAWLAVRDQALLRDHYECQRCLREVEAGRRLRPNRATMVHHLKPRQLYPELALCLDNLESLCNSCHNREHPERGFKPQRRDAGAGRRCVTITNERSLDRNG